MRKKIIFLVFGFHFFIINFKNIKKITYIIILDCLNREKFSLQNCVFRILIKFRKIKLAIKNYNCSESYPVPFKAILLYKFFYLEL